MSFPSSPRRWARRRRVGVIKDVTGNRVGAAMSSVQLAAGPRIGVIETISFSALVAPATAAERSSLVVGSLAVLGALLLATAVARSLTKPLVQMTAAAEGYSRGEVMALPTQSAGEIGVLARAFGRMLREVRDKTAALEKEVEEHRRTEAELQKRTDRERLFGAAVDSSVDAIITKTLDGIITSWNPAAEQLFGFTAAEAIGQHVEIIVPEDRREELRGILARIRCGELVEHHETVRRAKNGEPIEVSLSISPIKLPSGEIIGACKIAHDITEQKAAEEKFKLAVEACPNGMLMADRAGCMVMVNTAIENLFGYGRDELVGQSIEILVPEHLRTQHFEDRRNYAAKNMVRRMEAKQDLVGRRKDGTEFPVEIGLNPIQTRRRVFVLSVIVDITERKRLDRLKDAFVSTVSHELRTPLTSICGSLGLLMGTAAKDLPERTVRLLSLAQSNSERLVKLVNDILDIEKLEAGQVIFKFKLVELRPLIDQVVDSNRGYADTYLVRLRHDIQADGDVWADPDRLLQVVTNLISNAIKFSRPDGEVMVAVERRGNGLRLSVRDHGDGIPAEFKSSLEINRFDDVAVGAEIVTAGDVPIGIRRRQDDHRNTPELVLTLEDAEDLAAVLPRQIEIEQNEGRMIGLRPVRRAGEEFDRLDAVPGDRQFNIEFRRAERFARQVDIRCIVLDEKDVNCADHAGSPWMAGIVK
jgi:PAS domain S-box-containing protein